MNNIKDQWRIIILILFLSASALSLLVNSSYTVIFFALIILSSATALFPFVFTKHVLKKTVLALVVLLAIYGMYFHQIASIELWGDEIGVIQIADSDFGKIRETVSTLHAAVPPLDYWIMFFWKNVVYSFPDEYHEFVYRIPYMVMHGVAALLFALLIKESSIGKKATPEATLVFVLSFITYIFNPLLFAYSIEVRYYAFATLGSLTALYLFIRNQFFSLRYYPILLIFCLNSIFQFIVLLPYIFYGFIYQVVYRRNIVILFASLLALLVLTYPLLNIYHGVGRDASNRGILNALSNYWFIQFDSSLQLVLVVTILIYVLLFTTDRLFSLVLFSVLGFYLASTVTITYIEQYFAFHVRHLVFTVPVLLYLLFLPLMKTQGITRYIIVVLFAVFFTIPWAQKTNAMITNHDFFSKVLMGRKELVQASNKYLLDVIIAPDVGLPSFKTRFIDSVEWYLRTYSSAKIVRPQTQEDLCRMLKTDKRFIVYSSSDRIDCLSNDFQIKYFHESIIYLPI